MNTKNKIIAILFASIVAMAIAVPMAIGDDDREAETSVSVGNVAPDVCFKWEEPEGSIMPEQCPEPTRITIKACVCDPNGEDDIGSVEANVTDPGGNSMTLPLTRNTSMDCSLHSCPTVGVECVGYDGVLGLGCCDPAGFYRVVVTVTDKSGETGSMENEFMYESLIAMTASDVDFGVIAPGGSSTASSKVTVWGNDAILFEDVDPANYDNPDPGDGIVWSSMDCSDSNECGTDSIPDDAITTTWNQVVCIDCQQFANVPFTLDLAGVTVQSGPYAGTITFDPSHC